MYIHNDNLSLAFKLKIEAFIATTSIFAELLAPIKLYWKLECGIVTPFFLNQISNTIG